MRIAWILFRLGLIGNLLQYRQQKLPEFRRAVCYRFHGYMQSADGITPARNSIGELQKRTTPLCGIQQPDCGDIV